MKKLLSTLVILLLIGSTIMAAENNRIKIKADQDGKTISRHIYGHFSEHLGRCIYGGLWVGENSDVPNINGYRKDVVEALKGLDIPNLRWPGGCFADTYHWKDGIGPREKRPEIVNVHWGGVTEDNSFGTHEFMGLCELLNCEPVICGNVGSGTVQEMAEWVEYINSDALSPMTRLRKANGREKPWKMKYWGVGNESWGCGGTMTAQFYSDQLRRYSTFCRDYGDNRLYRIAGGANSGDFNWTEVLMREWHNASGWVRGYMQGLSLHYYTVCHTWDKKGSATDFNEEDWFLTMKNTLYMEELVTKHSAIMDKYDPEKSIGLIVDEWGNWHDVEPGTNPGFLYQQNSLRDALVAGINLNIFNNHCDRVKMANIAQTVNVLQSVVLTEGDKMVRTPTWYVFKMFKVHQDAMLLPLEVESKEYTFQGQSIPAVNASASKNAQGVIHISLTNADPNNRQMITCDLGSVKVSKINGEIITAGKINAYNEFNQREQVNIQPFSEAKIVDGKIVVDMPSKSVVMLTVY